VVGGTLITRTDAGGLANRFWMVFPSGRCVWYDKGHLFAPLGENTVLEAGKERVRTSVREWNVALSVCFDLRFPEQYRLDAIDGAEAFFVSSAWPEPRCVLLNTLARARAIENQAVLALCNRTGPGRPGERYCGGSVVVGADGRVLAEAGPDEGVVTADLKRSDVAAIRNALPVLPLRAAGLDW
jgi:predicted amidohydrolase